MKIKKGDTVKVLSGKDRGKEGKVISVDPKRQRLRVEGVHLAKKHQAPSQANEQGGIIEIVASIHASNVAVVCPTSKQAGRVGYRYEGDSKVRYHKKSGEVLS
ncbi:MAG: 50S ribosomal protein L24 [Acidimicrobiales bacterium]|jgi:large subunit ribosomal protein L24